MDWIDLALIGDEGALGAAIGSMSQTQLEEALANVGDALGIGEQDLLRGALRILVERARPLALPAELWRRPIDASTDTRRMVQDHFDRQGITSTGRRVENALRLYARFEAQRDNDLRVSVRHLETADWRCYHCGLEFHNEEVAGRAFISPFGNRRGQPVDRMKPQWGADGSLREPTLDHDWPVSLYGDNSSENLRVLCHGCNIGKENSIALEHLGAWIGLPRREELLRGPPVSPWVFYAQIRRSPECWRTGRTSRDAELTVETKLPSAAPVLDNLRTVAMD